MLSRSPNRSSRRGGTARGPTLCLHLSDGSLSWAVVDVAAGPLLIAAGIVPLAGEPAGEVLAALVAERQLPRAAARVAVRGTVHVYDPGAVDPGASQLLPGDGVTDVTLADGRVLRAALDRAALARVLEACERAGVEVVGAEPEALALARALAAPSPDVAPEAAVAVVWRAPLSITAVKVEGDVVELLGVADLPAGAGDRGIAAAAARLVAGGDCAEIVVATAVGDAFAFAQELAAVAGLRTRVGDPLARIRSAPDGPGEASAAAGAVGLALEVRGLPRVELPVRAARSGPPAGVGDAQSPAEPPPRATGLEGKASSRPGPSSARRGPSNRAVALIVASVVVVASLVGAWTTVERAAVRDRAAVLETLQAQLAAIPSPTAPTRRLLLLGADRKARVDAIAAVLGSRVAWDRILREISAVLPDGVWLRNVDATALTAGGLRLRGYATSQQVVALALARLAIVPDFADVRLERTERATVQGRDEIRFSIVASVRTEAR